MTDTIEAPAAPVPYKPGDPITVKLSRPLKTHKGELSELTLNMPTLRSFRLHGEMVRQVTVMPVGERGAATERRTEYAYNYESVMGFLADSTGIGAIELDGLAGNDVEYLANTLVGMTRLRPNS